MALSSFAFAKLKENDGDCGAISVAGCAGATADYAVACGAVATAGGAATVGWVFSFEANVWNLMDFFFYFLVSGLQFGFFKLPNFVKAKWFFLSLANN